MTNEQAVTANRAIVRAWIDDTAEHDIEDRYVRSVLTRFVARSNAIEPTPESVRAAAKVERDAAVAVDACHETRLICSCAADVLEHLADKLHEVSGAYAEPE